MNNQFIPEELLELKDGLALYLRPSNCKRYGLEPYCNSTVEFSYGARLGTNKNVGYHPEMIGSSKQHWYICQLNKKDGQTGNVKKNSQVCLKETRLAWPGWDIPW